MGLGTCSRAACCGFHVCLKENRKLTPPFVHSYLAVKPSQDESQGNVGGLNRSTGSAGLRVLGFRALGSRLDLGHRNLEFYGGGEPEFPPPEMHRGFQPLIQARTW